ncbi:F-box/kelch-repeat protein At3g06240-like [Papaver somniferum]|uniref:F-box/kelch-repeat protein At3g06240-like n=1 Tax=Papaver somniferum TaxID=3469 RepID=UPI000E6FE3BD|nr:F-box/kelch-repeat protein At3g06240-like [Papaver somniferum]
MKSKGKRMSNVEKFEHICNENLTLITQYKYLKGEARVIDCSRNGFSIVNSCNGVVCLTAPGGTVLLWNPSTRETRKIPRTTGFIGFGYDSEIGEFKMIELAKINPAKGKRRSVYSNYISDGEENLRVYSFESNSWKLIPKIPYKITTYDIIFFKGAFHWLARPCDGSKQVLVSFAMHDESFREVLLPQHFYHDDLRLTGRAEVGVLGGFLALDYTCYNVRTEIWLMKDFGGTNSWTQLCIMDLRVICEHPVTNGD